MKTSIILLLCMASISFYSFKGKLETKESQISHFAAKKADKCDCLTVYYSKSGYGKLKRFKKVSKNTSKQGCINRHKQITKYSGRTENQIPYSTYCGKIIIKG